MSHSIDKHPHILQTVCYYEAQAKSIKKIMIPIRKNFSLINAKIPAMTTMQLEFNFQSCFVPKSVNKLPLRNVMPTVSKLLLQIKIKETVFFCSKSETC